MSRSSPSRSSVTRWTVLIVALLLSLQFSGLAGAVCRTGDAARLVAAVTAPVDATSGDEQRASNGCCADPDCASCHATTPPLRSTPLAVERVASLATPSPSAPVPAFESAPARAPDRPQWLRLV